MNPPTLTPTSGGFGGGKRDESEEDRVRMVLERMMMMVFLKIQNQITRWWLSFFFSTVFC